MNAKKNTIFALLLFFCTLLLSSCGYFRSEKKQAKSEPVMEAMPITEPTPKPSRERYLLVGLAGENLHRETALRIIRQLRDQLTKEGVEVVLDTEMPVDAEKEAEWLQLMDDHFRLPQAATWRELGIWCDKVTAQRVVTCKLVEYGQSWRGEDLTKRTVLLVASDDVPAATRLARFQVVVEKSGATQTFDNLEQVAGEQIFARLSGNKPAVEKEESSWFRWPHWLKWP